MSNSDHECLVVEKEIFLSSLLEALLAMYGTVSLTLSSLRTQNSPDLSHVTPAPSSPRSFSSVTVAAISAFWGLLLWLYLASHPLGLAFVIRTTIRTPWLCLSCNGQVLLFYALIRNQGYRFLDWRVEQDCLTSSSLLLWLSCGCLKSLFFSHECFLPYLKDHSSSFKRSHLWIIQTIANLALLFFDFKEN